MRTGRLVMCIAGATSFPYGRPPPPFHERYGAELAAFESLYSADGLQLRNAASRTDGYWPYVSNKEEPPIDYTYGEFPLAFFTKVVDRACAIAQITDRAESTFCDLGSGAGRLVLWAAATSRWKRCVGVEFLGSLHKVAVEKQQEAARLPIEMPTAAVELIEGSWADEKLLPWSELDVVFSYTTALTYGKDLVLHDLTAAIAPNLRDGCIVCTTDYRLGDGFEVVDEIEGENEGVGGTSVAFIHRKVSGGLTEAERQAMRADELQAKLEAAEAIVRERDAQLAELTEVCERLEAERDQLMVERDQLAEQFDDTEAEMLGALKSWAAETDYLNPSSLSSGDGQPSDFRQSGSFLGKLNPFRSAGK